MPPRAQPRASSKPKVARKSRQSKAPPRAQPRIQARAQPRQSRAPPRAQPHAQHQRRRASAETGNRGRVARESRLSKRTLTKYSKANDTMNIIELQKMARDQGIPFGGLSKSKLLRKINKYLESYY